MIKFELTEEFRKRLSNFISSNLFTNQASHSKSEYWKYHSDLISYKIKGSFLYLTGNSGNYIPDRKYSYQFYLRSLKIFIKKILGLDTAGPDSSFFLSYKKAFKVGLLWGFVYNMAVVYWLAFNIGTTQSIATFTMVNVLKNQKLFNQALDVLDILVTKGAETEKIQAERDAIKNLIKKENN